MVPRDPVTLLLLVCALFVASMIGSGRASICHRLIIVSYTLATFGGFNFGYSSTILVEFVSVGAGYLRKPVDVRCGSIASV
jgi:hypothetical protein